MQWPAGRRDSIGFLPYGARSNPLNFPATGHAGARIAQATGGVISRTASYPDGYGRNAYIMPVTAGGMSSWQSVITVSGSADMLSGGPMEGSATLSFVGDGDASLIISLAGSGAATWSATGSVSLTIGLAGDGTISLTGDGGLSMIVPMEGAGSWAMAGLGDMRGRLAMDGSWSPYTELSPQSLATAVWSALAAANNEPGTMGDLLNAAGGGGISGAVIDQIAEAVWEVLDLNGREYGAVLTSSEKWAKLAVALSA